MSPTFCSSMSPGSAPAPTSSASTWVMPQSCTSPERRHLGVQIRPVGTESSKELVKSGEKRAGWQPRGKSPFLRPSESGSLPHLHVAVSGADRPFWLHFSPFLLYWRLHQSGFLEGNTAPSRVRRGEAALEIPASCHDGVPGPHAFPCGPNQ